MTTADVPTWPHVVLEEAARIAHDDQQLRAILFHALPTMVRRWFPTMVRDDADIFHTDLPFSPGVTRVVAAAMRNPSFDLHTFDFGILMLRQWPCLAENPSMVWWYSSLDLQLGRIARTVYGHMENAMYGSLLMEQLDLINAQGLARAHVVVKGFQEGIQRLLPDAEPLPDPGDDPSTFAIRRWRRRVWSWMHRLESKPITGYRNTKRLLMSLTFVVVNAAEPREPVATTDRGINLATDLLNQQSGYAHREEAWLLALTHHVPTYLAFVRGLMNAQGKAMPRHLLYQCLDPHATDQA